MHVGTTLSVEFLGTIDENQWKLWYMGLEGLMLDMKLLYVNWNFTNACILNLVFYMMCSGQRCYLTGAMIVWEVFYAFACSDWRCILTVLWLCSCV